MLYQRNICVFSATNLMSNNNDDNIYSQVENIHRCNFLKVDFKVETNIKHQVIDGMAYLNLPDYDT